jgi:DNA polymerase-1
MPRLVLIDGSSYLYRAFHALPPLTAPDGTPTGALFGVVNMLRATLKEAPEHAAFVLDASGPTFRETLDPEYKAHRPPMPDDLRAQVEPMIAIVEALGFPMLRVPGVEADDVIGTLAVQGAAQGLEVTVSTSDKDFAQLVRPGITLTNTMSGSKLANDADVIEKFGVRADQIIDYLSLMGDSVDNVPGVDKCGPKTAAKWLGEYGTLEAVMANAGKIGGKIGENLRAALPRLPLNRELVTIKTDVALDRGPSQLELRSRDVERLRALYHQYGFHAAARELDGAGASGASGASSGSTARVASIDPTWSAKGEVECVLTEAQLATWVDALRAAPLIAFDTETDGLDPQQANLVGVSLCVAVGKACYIPLAHVYAGAPAQLPWATVREALKPLLEDAGKPKLGQNGKFDIEVLARHGIDLQGYAEDTLLMSFVLDAGLNRHDMDALAERHLGYATIKFEEVCGKGAKQITFDQVDLERATAYAAEDADVTLRLYAAMRPRLAAEASLDAVYRDIEMPLVPVLARMERTGVRIDVAELKRQSAEHAKRLHAIEQEAHGIAGRPFNLDSPKQLQALLFDELKLPALVKTPTGQPSTNEEALDAIADEHALPRLILEHRGLAKLKSTYTDKLSESVNPLTGRVHTRYNQAGAATGRLSSNDPNLQNIPIRTPEGRQIRRAFVAPQGRVILACDYSQIELRIMAHLSEDPGLLSAFAEGLDVHRATASEVFGASLGQVTGDQRRAAKAINFGLIYGMSAFGLARQLGIDRGQAQDYIGLYFSRYPGVRAYMDRTREQAKEKGYVETVFGRRLHLAEIRSRNQAQRAGAERAAINAPMQGTAADIIKRAMVSVDAWTVPRADRIAMLMQVHDELVFEVDAGFVDEAKAEILQRMEAAAELRVPLLVEAGVGATWDEAH